MNFLDARLPGRFWSKCIPEPNSGCWLWFGSLTVCGYGNLGWNGKVVRAHRLTFETATGFLGGYQLDHLCRVRCCVNPAHLEPVTGKENVQRGMHGRLRTHCKHGHAYADHARIELQRDGYEHRRCMVCRDETLSRWGERRRERTLRWNANGRIGFSR